MMAKSLQAFLGMGVYGEIGFDHRIGQFRPLRMATRVRECHIDLRLGRFGLEKRLLRWPTP